MTIYPSILTDSLAEAQEQLDKLHAQTQNAIKVVQFDIVDGIFADNITFDPIDILELHTYDFRADIHLMTVDPINDVIECSALPFVRAIIGQVEKMPSQQAFIDIVKAQQQLVGLSLDLYTPLSAIEDDIWQQLDLVQIMTIPAGFQGQIFQAIGLEKVREVKEILKNKDLGLEIIVDGGVKLENVALVQDTGADAITVGSYLWKANNFSEALQQLSLRI